MNYIKIQLVGPCSNRGASIINKDKNAAIGDVNMNVFPIRKTLAVVYLDICT